MAIADENTGATMCYKDRSVLSHVFWIPTQCADLPSGYN